MNSLKHNIPILFVCLFLIITIENLNAEDNKESKKNVVARVNNISIDAEEFKLNYEFGFPHLKVGKTLEAVSYTHLTLPTSDLV